MSDVKRIVEAMAALAAAIPGASAEAGDTSVSLYNCDDVTLRLLVDEGGHRHTYTNGARTEEWDAVELVVGAVSVNAYSKWRPITKFEPDSTAVESALKLTKEALS